MTFCYTHQIEPLVVGLIDKHVQVTLKLLNCKFSRSLSSPPLSSRSENVSCYKFSPSRNTKKKRVQLKLIFIPVYIDFPICVRPPLAHF